jgi:hypothetical protein
MTRVLTLTHGSLTVTRTLYDVPQTNGTVLAGGDPDRIERELKDMRHRAVQLANLPAEPRRFPKQRPAPPEPGL